MSFSNKKKELLMSTEARLAQMLSECHHEKISFTFMFFYRSHRFERLLGYFRKLRDFRQKRSF